MKNHRYELITFLIVLVVSFVVVEWKKEQVRTSRSQKVESVLGLLIAEGTPVHTLILEPQSFLMEKMVTLQECQRNMLCASISGQDRKHIEPGQHILRAKDGELLGKVVRVGSRRNFRNGLFKVTVKPLQKIEATSVVSKIVTEVIPGTISVPNSSVILEDDGFYVWKVDSENTATKVKVEVGHKSAGATEIKVGLKAGDQIVFRGAAQVAKYKKIKIMDTKKSSELQASAI